MTSQSGGGGYPGVRTDTHQGLIILGGLQAGNPNAATAPSFHTLSGNVVIQDTPGNINDFDTVVDIRQEAAVLPSGAGESAVTLVRVGDISQQDYAAPAILITDGTLSAQPVLDIQKSGHTQLRVDGDGVLIHDKVKVASTVGHVLGAYSGDAVPVYDANGTALGFIPIYA